MSNDTFDGHVLTEKLTKLNNSQQSIESLSRWCISHRKKARQIVETWDKLFNSLSREQSLSFLYLANDILQNSRRKGSEFVNEFWKVLPSSLKHVYDSGDEHGKKAATRLVDIWEERKVFGSRGHSLKGEMLGKDPPPPLASNGKSTNPIKIVKRDANSVRIKLAVGGLPEKILTAFQSVHDEHLNEEVALEKCNAAVQYVGKIEEDFGNISAQGNQQGTVPVNELEEQEIVLGQCVGQLENAEATRAALVSQLKEALQDQESKLELIRNQLQVARGRIEQASNMKKGLTSSSITFPLISTHNSATEATRAIGQNSPSVQQASTPLQPPLTHSVLSFAPLRTTEEENKKAAAAAVVAKLAASTSSAQMLSSVLSSLVAEEAASKNGGLRSAGFSMGLAMFPPEKRLKLEKPTTVSDANNSDVVNPTYFTPLQQQQTANMQTMSQANQILSPFALSMPPQPPSLSPGNPTANQFVQSAGPMVGVMPYGYGASTLPPPPPLPPHIAMGLTRPATQPSQHPQQPPPQQSSHSQSQQQPQQQQQQQQPQPPTNGGYYRPPSMGFFGQNHQATTPAVPRQ